MSAFEPFEEFVDIETLPKASATRTPAPAGSP